MIKFIHCVFVKHLGSDKKYLFCVDNIERLKNMQEVLCETKYGEAEGVCACDSFTVSENALISIAQALGANLPLKKIVGIIEHKPILSKEVTRFDELPF